MITWIFQIHLIVSERILLIPKTGKSKIYAYKLLGKTDDLSDDTEKQQDDELTVPSSKSVHSEEKYG